MQQQFPIHDYAQMRPAMQKKERDALKQDIECNGVRFPVTLHQGQIIDGRHRVGICAELGIVIDAAKVVNFQGNDASALGFVLNNGNWSQLSSAQKSVTAARALEAAEACGASLTQEAIAKRYGISTRLVRDGVKIVNECPQLADAVADKQLTIHAAINLLKADHAALEAFLMASPDERKALRKTGSNSANALAKAIKVIMTLDLRVEMANMTEEERETMRSAKTALHRLAALSRQSDLPV